MVGVDDDHYVSVGLPKPHTFRARLDKVITLIGDIGKAIELNAKTNRELRYREYRKEQGTERGLGTLAT